MSDILTVEEVATLLKISKRSVYELTRERSRRAQEKPIPVIRINGKTVRFNRDSVMAWLESREER